MPTRLRGRTGVLLAALLLPPGVVLAQTEAEIEKFSRADLEIVDCLLPGQVRQLGSRTYLSPRRPTMTTASDCRLRGGEYVAFDRANLQTALRVWMDAAQGGDAEAQNQVGEIFERGLGGEPDFEAAVLWYGKAAEQGNASAQFNLGSMYEQGLGVPQDRLRALNLYRQSWGLKEDALIYRSAALREQQQLREELSTQVAAVEQRLEDKDAQLALMQTQIVRQGEELARADQKASEREMARANDERQPDQKRRVSSIGNLDALEQADLAVMRKLIESLQADRDASRRELDALRAQVAALPAADADAGADEPLLRTPGTVEATSQIDAAAVARVLDGVSFGRYYALVIGNQDYQLMTKLQTPGNDAERVASVLREQYGFTVQVLQDSGDIAMLQALNELNKVLRPEDNLLIYYAGHGVRLQTHRMETGYWLPVNSEPPPKDTFWIPNEQITAHIARLPARRVLIVADSCYAGLLSPDPSYLFADGKSGYSAEYIKFKLPKRARLLIASGGDQPVLDGGGDGHSVFARAFLDALQSNRGILASQQLFSGIVDRVRGSEAQKQQAQQPEFKSIKGAGHEVGEFFFVPTALAGIGRAAGG
ncbi:caspase family protein [Panacagrimonas sp.]|uniref:caspase family protein n=1 Tax=Panacagrimonas sp. TaxID=2480088 RepID=UPI003B51AC79